MLHGMKLFKRDQIRTPQDMRPPSVIRLSDDDIATTCEHATGCKQHAIADHADTSKPAERTSVISLAVICARARMTFGIIASESSGTGIAPRFAPRCVCRRLVPRSKMLACGARLATTAITPSDVRLSVRCTRRINVPVCRGYPPTM